MEAGRAVIIGVGDGLSASLARDLARDHALTLAARSGEKMREVAAETGAETVLLDATDEAAVGALFDALPEPPRVVIYNPSSRVRGPVAELAADDVRRAVEVTAIGAFLTGKHAARRMLGSEPVNGCRGTILFTIDKLVKMVEGRCIACSHLRVGHSVFEWPCPVRRRKLARIGGCLRAVRRLVQLPCRFFLRSSGDWHLAGAHLGLWSVGPHRGGDFGNRTGFWHPRASGQRLRDANRLRAGPENGLLGCDRVVAVSADAHLVRARKRAEDRKAEILQAALDLAFEAGPDRLTTGMIADRLGLTQPAIYKHFRNKEDIWQAVADSLCDLIAANIARSRDTSMPSEGRLRQLVLGHLQLVRDNPALPQIMVMRDPSGAQSAPLTQIRASMSGFRDNMIDIIRQAQFTGRFRTDIGAPDGATLIFGIVQGLVLRLLLTRDPEILLREGERLLDLQFSLLTENGDSN